MVDSTDATKKTVWIGGVDGGLWKTTDITATSPTWTLVNDYLSNLAVAAICQDPRPGFQNIMYFCTGESYYNADAVQGVGVFKSTNGGATWSFLASTSTFVNGTRILCDYLGNVYLATRGTGLRRSTDGGTTWTNITPTGLVSDICDLEISSTSAAGRLHVVAGIFTTQAYRYTDIPATVAAGTWTAPAAAFPSYSMRCEIAVSGSTLYACPVNASYQVPTIYKSTNGGANWAATTAQPTAGWTNGQGWYDVEVGIDPSNVNNVIVGGLDTYKTTNGGTSWTKMSEWVGTSGQYVHADIHKIAWFDGGNKLVIASDGGVFYSTDKGTTIRDRNLGLRIKQFYSCAIHPTTTNYFLAGAQDNGSHQFSNPGLSTSIEVTGGDGAFVAIDQVQPQYQFTSYVFNQYRRSTNGGSSWSVVNYSASAGQFINPFDYDNLTQKIYASGNMNTYVRWDNPRTGSTFVAVSVTLNNNKVSAVKASPFTTNLVYIGTDDYDNNTNGGGTCRLLKLENANTATPTVTDIKAAGMPVSATFSCINTGTNDNNLIVSLSNYGINNVWVSTNGGTAWSAIDGNLPNMPVRWCMFYPGSNTKAIIATETGVWQTDLINGASTVWVAETGFPTVRTDMLQYRALDGTIAAATHGRGLWTTTLCSPPPVSVSPVNSLICNPGGTGITLTAIGATTYTWSPATGLSATTGASVTATPSTTTTYTVTGTDGAGCVNTATATVTVANKPTIAPTATPATVCSGANSVLNANVSAPPAYCIPTYSTGTGSGDWISLVQIASTTLNNTSAGAAASPYYTLYPASGATTASLAANTAYTMTVSGGTFATCLIRGWIDYNQDGVFTAAESIGISPNVGASATGTIVFTPPLTAYNGTTRMRLRSSDANPGPGTGDFCAATNSNFGETEDYDITITGGVVQYSYLWSPATFLSGTTTNPTTATAVTVTTPYNLTVSSINGCSSTSSVTVTVNTVTVTNPGVATGTTGVVFSQAFTQTGAIGGATFSINSGTLPTGLTLSPAGLLSGTPTVSGSFPITVKVTGGNGCIGIGGPYNLVIISSTVTLNLTAFLEGFYTGSSTMRANLFDLGLSADPSATDNITVNLWSPASLSSPTPNHTISTLLHTNGTATMQFPGAVNGNSFYIAVKHRNSMETWSKTAVPFTTTTSYDFSTGLIKAYDDGVNPPMANMGASMFGDVYAFYGGDVNQDYTIDGGDANDIEIGANNFDFGYNAADANGDGETGGQDANIVEINANLFLYYARPF